jgi:hypothetical protein
MSDRPARKNRKKPKAKKSDDSARSTSKPPSDSRSNKSHSAPPPPPPPAAVAAAASHKSDGDPDGRVRENRLDIHVTIQFILITVFGSSLFLAQWELIYWMFPDSAGWRFIAFCIMVGVAGSLLWFYQALKTVWFLGLCSKWLRRDEKKKDKEEEEEAEKEKDIEAARPDVEEEEEEENGDSTSASEPLLASRPPAVNDLRQLFPV